MAHVSNTADTIDIRDVIDRVEELRDSRDEYDGFHNTPGAWAKIDDGEPEELKALESFLGECRGNGGGHQWEGDWYPVTLIRDSYFTQYARELAEELGSVNGQEGWPLNCIDWEQAASELQQDYTGIEFDGVTYYCR